MKDVIHKRELLAPKTYCGLKATKKVPYGLVNRISYTRVNEDVTCKRCKKRINKNK